MLIALTDGSALRGPPLPPPNGLKVWLKADSGVATSGSNVTTWTDHANGIVFTETDSGHPALLVPNSINGLPAIRFNNLDGNHQSCYLSGAIDPRLWVGITAIYVHRTVASGTIPSWSCVFGLQQNGVAWWNMACGSNTDPTQALGWAGIGGAVNFGSTAGVTNGQIVTQAYRYDKISWNISGTFNSGPVADTSFPTSVVTALIGTNTYGGGTGTQNNGDIAEVLIYDHSLSGADLAIVNTYLHSRYGT